MGLSAFVALSLTPALCAMMLKPHDPNAHQGFLGRFFDKFNTWFEAKTESYGETVANLIGKAKLGVLFLIILINFVRALYKMVPTTFVPEEDQGYYVTSVSLPEGTSLNRTEETVDKIAAQIGRVAGVARTLAISGYDILSGSTKSSAGSISGLEPWSARKTKETQIQSLVMQTMMNSAKVTRS